MYLFDNQWQHVGSIWIICLCFQRKKWTQIYLVIAQQIPPRLMCILFSMPKRFHEHQHKTATFTILILIFERNIYGATFVMHISQRRSQKYIFEKQKHVCVYFVAGHNWDITLQDLYRISNHAHFIFAESQVQYYCWICWLLDFQIRQIFELDFEM